jgi:hypothetical protein
MIRIEYLNKILEKSFGNVHNTDGINQKRFGAI